MNLEILEKDFFKQIQDVLKQKYGFLKNKYCSRPKDLYFYRKRDEFYECISFTKDKGFPGSIIIVLFCSPVITTSRYDYGKISPIQESLVFTGSYDQLEIPYNSPTFELQKFNNAEAALNEFNQRFNSVSKFYNYSKEKMLKDLVVKMKLDFVKDIADQFVVNWDKYKLMSEKELIEKFIIEFRKKVLDQFYNYLDMKHLNFSEIKSFYGTPILWDKTFEKHLNTSLDMRDKFLVYGLMRRFSPTKDHEVDRALRHTRESAPFGNESTFIYSSFMTYIEKAY